MSNAEKWRDGTDRIVFVGGCPRSGTTLVQNLLDSHPGIFGGPEFDLIPDIVALREGLQRSVAAGRIAAFCDAARVDEVIAQLISSLLLPLADRASCQLLSEKTPSNALVARSLLDCLPGSRFIFVVRDPRAVIASMFAVGRRAATKAVAAPPYTRSLRHAIAAVRRYLDAGYDALAAHPDRTLLVVYENLVRRPVTATERLCAFLGVDWSESMVRPSQQDHLGRVGVDGIWYHASMYRRDPDPSSVLRWQRELDRSTRTAIEMAFDTDERLRALGYDFASTNVAPASRTYDRMRVTGFALRRAVGPPLRSALRRLGS
ncbi:MAG: sulfotransferase family protein [Egibacteraceae bacterium]